MNYYTNMSSLYVDDKVRMGHYTYQTIDRYSV